jgi:hypothetical protein
VTFPTFLPYSRHYIIYILVCVKNPTPYLNGLKLFVLEIPTPYLNGLKLFTLKKLSGAEWQ